MTGCTLTVNAGSSSIKFALFEPGAQPRRTVWGQIDNIGGANARLALHGTASGQDEALGPLDQAGAATALIDRIEAAVGFGAIAAVGHRLVHGGPSHSSPQIISPALLSYLREIIPYAPQHLPGAIGLIQAFQRARDVPQIACFDTDFHSAMPAVAKLLPIPRRFAAKGVRRYGFHGLSYAYLMAELARIAPSRTAPGRVILAHLGHGASLAAVLNGVSIDTSMGFTPASGVPMSTRAGQLDPGLFAYLAQTEGMSPRAIDDMLTGQSGLLGVSETSGDVRDLLARESADLRAAEALGLFCYQVRKYIGAYAAALGGLDALVFAGGIGEHSPVIRARICEGLGFLGLMIDPARNAANGGLISSGNVDVRVIATNEEVMIAKAVAQVLGRLTTIPTAQETGHG